MKDSGGNSLATFTYDYTGKRTSMTTASGTINFHYAGNNVIYETDASNNIVADYTWDAQGRPVTMTKGGLTYYYQLNGHGDVTKLTDTSGNVVAEYQYDAWGNIISQSGTMASANPYRYAGYRYDEVTGLYYLMARYYDAGVGRFITRDTFHGFDSEPLTLNQYVYTNNNPLIGIDPSGHGTIIVVLTRDFLRDAVRGGITLAATLAVGYITSVAPLLSPFRKVLASSLAGYLTYVLSGVISRNITRNYVWYKDAWYLPNRYFSYGG